MSEMLRRIEKLAPAQRDCLVRLVIEAIGQLNDDHVGNHLAAFIELESGASPIQSTELRRHLAEHLPAQLVPVIFTQVGEFPRQPNGKVDRTALIAMSGIDDGRIGESPADAAFVAPRTRTELSLAKIWQDVLGCGMVSVNDQFFEIGGDSLLAIQVVSRAHQAGLDVGPDEVLERQTIAKLATYLDAKATADVPGEPIEAAASAQLIPIQKQGTGSALYFIHTLGEGFEYCKSLVPHLATHRPIYGISMYDGGRLPDGDIRPYVRQLRKHQPHGPYYLAGIYCGGRTAFKLACFLRELGEEVALLALIHTVTDRTVFKNLSIAGRLEAHWQNLRRGGLRHLRGRAAQWNAQFRKSSHTLSLEQLVAHRNFRFHPTPFDGTIDLFRASEVLPFVEPELGWSNVAAGGLRIHDIVGGTTELFRPPGVQQLGEGLQSLLEQR